MLDTNTLQAECRAFAGQFPTPNVALAIELADAGRVAWADIHALFTRSLGRALAEVTA